MRTVVVRNGTRILLGKQGENNAVRVVWPEIAEKYTKLYGDGRFELVVVQKGQAYPAVVNVDGPDLIWNVLTATEVKAALQAVYNNLNHGQRKKLLRNPSIRAMFERYRVETDEK